MIEIFLLFCLRSLTVEKMEIFGMFFRGDFLRHSFYKILNFRRFFEKKLKSVCLTTYCVYKF